MTNGPLDSSGCGTDRRQPERMDATTSQRVGRRGGKLDFQPTSARVINIAATVAHQLENHAVRQVLYQAKAIQARLQPVREAPGAGPISPPWDPGFRVRSHA